MTEYKDYLEGIMPADVDHVKYQKRFRKEGRYQKDGYYNWNGHYSTNPRIVYLMGVLEDLKVPFTTH
jgi:hypothetical protein